MILGYFSFRSFIIFDIVSLKADPSISNETSLDQSEYSCTLIHAIPKKSTFVPSGNVALACSQSKILT